jgi:adenylate cyclase
MSGVEIQAQVGDMILQNSSLIPLPRSLAMLWVLLAALLASLPFFFIRSAKRAFIASLLTGIIHAPLAIILFEQGWIPNILHVHLSWALGVLAAVLYRHLVSEKESRMMRQAFGKYVSKDVLEEILKDTTKIKLGGEERNATIFFSDVRGFTTLSESLSPTELTTFLNRYLTRMTDIALEERGVVDKYIGDAIMVFWGAPLENLKHPDDAVHAALRMTDALDAFNKESEAQGDPRIDIGIGMNTGDVVVGNMGSNQRFDYTVMGDAVNLASRLEGQTFKMTSCICKKVSNTFG